MSGLQLNPEQRAAVEHGEGPLLVLAGAGSGKTRVLTARAARLIEHGLDPHRLIAVTFTNKAAGEMRERIEGLLGQSTRGLWVGTFHSIGVRLLRTEAGHTTRTRSFTIYDQDDALRTLKGVMKSLDYDPKQWLPRPIMSRISALKNALVAPDDFEPEDYRRFDEIVARVYPAYERELRDCNAYDFDSLLVESVRLLEGVEVVGRHYAGRFRHVLVDEYQDTNHAQYRMVKAFAAEHRNLCVVGDDDQAVYGWRGADIQNILDFEADFAGAEVVRLERNYRSTGSILEVANAVIEWNVNRKPKRLRAQREAGEPIPVIRCDDDRAEAAWVSSEIKRECAQRGWNEFAVLYRTNAQSRTFEEAFRRGRVPYRIVGGVPFYERREVKDVISYLRLLVNPADDVAFRRAVNWPRRGIGGRTIERLTDAAEKAGRPLAVAAMRDGDVNLLAAGIKAASLRNLHRFSDALDQLRISLSAQSAREAMEACVATFGLATALSEEEDEQDRLENVSELFAAAEAFDRGDVEDAEGAAGGEDAENATDLELFLQSVSLRTDLDETDFGGEAVTLMTLHNAKGLEFPVVYLAGLEEGLFPNSRSVDAPGGLEEERRLFYVGVTRAMDHLSLTYADRRWRAGTVSYSDPSSFLDELPAEHTRERSASRRYGGRSGYGAGSRGYGAGSRGYRRRDRGSAGRGGGSNARERSIAGGGRSSAGSGRSAEGRGRSGGRDPDKFDQSGGSPAFGGQPDEAGVGPGLAGPGQNFGNGAGGASGGAGEGERELVYDYEESQEPLRLAPGVRVIHQHFGTGEVLQVRGQGRAAKVDIEFDEAGRKRVAVAYANLRPG